MSEKRKKGSFVTIGVTTLLMVFMVLCLLTFAVLSLVSAQADLKMSEKAAQRTTLYYEAENKANDILKKIDEYLQEQYNNSKDENELKQALYELRDQLGKEISVDDMDGEPFISYSVSIDEQQELLVELDVRYEPQKGAFYQIRQWKVTDRTVWEADTLPVLQLSVAGDNSLLKVVPPADVRGTQMKYVSKADARLDASTPGGVLES